MPITAIAAIVMGFSGPAPLYCPATLEKITGKPALVVEYAGTLFGTCCAGCGNPLLKDPAPLIANAIKEKKTVGTFEYDAVTGAKIDTTKAPVYSDYRSIRYFFSSTDEKKTFDKTPGAYVSAVKSEAYFCPVGKQATTSKDAGAFADYNGVRYFLCCGDCLKQFKADPSKFIANAASAVKPLVAVAMK